MTSGRAAQRVGRRVAAVLLIIAAFVGATSGVAFAHARLISSTPSRDQVFESSPTELSLTFSEAVDLAERAIRLLRADGSEVDLGSIELDSDGTTVRAAITVTLADGSYVMSYAVISTDSHPISGAIPFSVGAPSGDTSELVDSLGTTTAAGTSTSTDIGRGASFLGVLALVGIALLAPVLVPARLGSRRVAWLLATAGMVAVIGTVAMICAQAAAIGSNAWDWGSVSATRSGRWWIARLAVVVGALALLPHRRRLADRRVHIGAVIAAAVICSIVALGGHAVSGRARPLGFVASVAHLGAASVWIGGLIVITCIAKRTETLFTAQRLSLVALASVVTLAASGSFNGWRQLHGLGSITDSSYGRWLLVKLVVMVVVVVLAAVNRALVRSAAWPAGSPATEADLAAPVRRLVFAELAGIVVILAATAGLTGATPPAPPGASDVSVSVARGNLIADIELIPASTGGTSMHVTITATDGQFVRVSEITVTAVLAAEALGPIELPVFDAGPNHVTSNNADFPVPGLWSIIVTARLGEFDQAVFTADVAITSA